VHPNNGSSWLRGKINCSILLTLDGDGSCITNGTTMLSNAAKKMKHVLSRLAISEALLSYLYQAYCVNKKTLISLKGN
jgi:hypothetical protein